MKHIFVSKHLLVLMLTLGISLGTSIVAANADLTQPLSVQMTLASGNNIVSGEPIVLLYKVSNSNASSLSVEMGLDGGAEGTDWVTRTLIDASGKQVLPLPDLLLRDSGGLHANGVIVQPQIDRKGYLVVNHWFAISQPGRYTLAVHVHLPYVVGTSGQTGETHEGNPQPYDKDFTFPLTITQANSANIPLLAQSLLDKATVSTDLEERRMLVQSLFSLPQAQVWPQWEAAASFPSLLNLVMAEAMRISSVQTADVLAQIGWGELVTSSPASGEKRDRDNAVQVKLRQMYDRSSGSLRQHIKALYALHGVDVTKENIYVLNG